MDETSLGVIPTIVCSGSSLEVDVLKAYKLGANAYLTKPQSIANLTAILRATMEFWSLAEKLPGKDGG